MGISKLKSNRLTEIDSDSLKVSTLLSYSQENTFDNIIYITKNCRKRNIRVKMNTFKVSTYICGNNLSVSNYIVNSKRIEN